MFPSLSIVQKLKNNGGIPYTTHEAQITPTPFLLGEYPNNYTNYKKIHNLRLLFYIKVVLYYFRRIATSKFQLSICMSSEISSRKAVIFSGSIINL